MEKIKDPATKSLENLTRLFLIIKTSISFLFCISILLEYLKNGNFDNYAEGTLIFYVLFIRSFVFGLPITIIYHMIIKNIKKPPLVLKISTF